MTDVPLKDTLTVTIDGSTFIFAVPTLFDEIRIGNRVATLRAAALGPDELDPGVSSIDATTMSYLRACAVFELQLQKCSEKWPYAEGPKGPIVDSKAWPADKAETAMNAYWGYVAELNSFRKGGNTDKPPADGQVVAGSQADVGQP